MQERAKQPTAITQVCAPSSIILVAAVLLAGKNGNRANMQQCTDMAMIGPNEQTGISDF
jgi:hypothetical protein